MKCWHNKAEGVRVRGVCIACWARQALLLEGQMRKMIDALEARRVREDWPAIGHVIDRSKKLIDNN